jgi:hypothetical protein
MSDKHGGTLAREHDGHTIGDGIFQKRSRQHIWGAVYTCGVAPIFTLDAILAGLGLGHDVWCAVLQGQHKVLVCKLRSLPGFFATLC